MGPVRRYGDALALVTVTRSAASPDRVLTSLAAATDRPCRVVVVDTGGAPVPERVAVIRIREDVGRSAAVNRAVAGLDGDVGWVAVADPQVQWAEGALDVLLDAAARYPRAGALGPLLRDRSGATPASAGPLPSLGDALRGRVPVSRAAAGPVGWLAGTCLLLRRAAWDSVDGLDPRYPGALTRAFRGHARGRARAWAESARVDEVDLGDVDFGDRVGRAGWLVVRVPGAEVTVHGRDTQGVLEPSDRGVRRYVRDRYPAPARALVALMRRG